MQIPNEKKKKQKGRKNMYAEAQPIQSVLKA